MARPRIEGERVHVILTKPQLRHIDRRVRETGLTRSDLIRRAVDSQIQRDNKARNK